MSRFRALALARKELYSSAHSPALYGTAVFFLLFLSVWFFYFENFFARNTASLRSFFGAFPLVFILVIPALTMKSWAEEGKTGTLELLLTLPFTEWDLTLGKFIPVFGSLVFFCALTLPVPLSVLPLGNFDGGVIAAEYLGVILLAASASALGNLLSALAKNQGGAFLGSAAALLGVMLMNQLVLILNLPGALAEGLNFFSLSFHFESFSRGLIDSRDLAFFVLSTALFLFLNTRVISYRRWS
jgi:ABC-2 type transport system permease protein